MSMFLELDGPLEVLNKALESDPGFRARFEGWLRNLPTQFLPHERYLLLEIYAEKLEQVREARKGSPGNMTKAFSQADWERFAMLRMDAEDEAIQDRLAKARTRARDQADQAAAQRAAAEMQGTPKVSESARQAQEGGQGSHGVAASNEAGGQARDSCEPPAATEAQETETATAASPQGTSLLEPPGTLSSHADTSKHKAADALGGHQVAMPSAGSTSSSPPARTFGHRTIPGRSRSRSTRRAPRPSKESASVASGRDPP